MSSHIPVRQISLPTALWAAPAVLLVVAIGPWPYGFYTLLRLAVCGAAGYLACALIRRSPGLWLGWAFVGLALLYNPVIRVHLDRYTWVFLNLASAVLFAATGWLSQRTREGPPR
ncbi:MAG TPA: DUF6804 family protein [Phenylobacterium sp.]